MWTTTQQRDKFLFRFLVGGICLLPIVLCVVQISFGHSSSAAFDVVNAVYCGILLVLAVSLLVLCFNVWKRNRQMALIGFALLAALVVLWMVSI
jgi:FtsH-binding integral membrane protein